MLPTRQGSIRLFRIAGITIYLHWLWFVVALYEVNNRRGSYSSPVWNLLEYVALFSIILLHELGHALACRQVGGTADQIILWPLGGVAFVSPPPRPGATLWSIAAGPLVNVCLAPPLTMLVILARTGWADNMPNAYALIHAICLINYGLLIFNMLPIYPLDGGQILRALLWFPLGRGRSLMLTTVVGFIGVAALIVLAIAERSFWIGLIAVFILLNCWRGLVQARLLARAAKLPRRTGFACPNCKEPPFRGALWRCGKCLKPFDTFETMAGCPHCGTQFPVTQCFDCGSSYPIHDWLLPSSIVSTSSTSEGNSTVA